MIANPGSGPNNILQLCVVVIDKFDSFAIATVNITSSPPDAADLTSDAIDNLFDSAIGEQLQSGDSDAATSALIAVTETVLGSNETSGESCDRLAITKLAAVTAAPTSSNLIMS